jgi:hypothetical protein
MYRKTWMFPRNKRYIEPYKIVTIIRILRNIVGEEEWSGNQEIQNKFTKSLEQHGIKKTGDQRDERSGGARTYIAQLELLGLVFEKDEIHYPTIAGEKLANGENSIEIMQHQLINLQYPSPYSRSSTKNIDPTIKIKPLKFVLEILQDSRINYLTEVETVIPVIYGRAESEKLSCIKKILKLRKLNVNSRSKKDDKENLKKIINNTNDLLTYRSTINNSNFDARVTDLCEIANTLVNYLHANLLISKEKHNKTYKYIINSEFLPNINEIINLANNYIPYEYSPDRLVRVKKDETFQRKFGKYKNRKDTRSITKIITDSPTLGKEDFIRLEFDKYMDLKLKDHIPPEFYSIMHREKNITQNEVVSSLKTIINNSRTEFENKLISDSQSSKGIDFEKSLFKLFKYIFRLDTQHTGQKRGSSGHTYTDIMLIKNSKNQCGIIDAKATKDTYTISLADTSIMIQEYSKNYVDIAPINCNLSFIGYICGKMNYGSDYDNKLNKIKTETTVPACILDAHNILEISHIYDSDEDKLFNFFESGGVLDCNNYKVF